MAGSYVYRITNTVTGAAYIGSTTVSLSRRWSVHQNELKQGKHCNKHLQRAWKKHGGDAFLFEEVESNIPKSEILEREQDWIDERLSSLPRAMTYNISLRANHTLGRRSTDEERAARSARMKGVPRTIESRRKQSDNWKYKDCKKYSLKSPAGEIHKDIPNLRAFCRENGLSETVISSIVRGKNGVLCHKGWTLPHVEATSYVVTSPDGMQHSGIPNLKRFCIEHGIPYKQLHGMLQGGKKSCKGWTVSVSGKRRRIKSKECAA